MFSYLYQTEYQNNNKAVDFEKWSYEQKKKQSQATSKKKKEGGGGAGGRGEKMGCKDVNILHCMCMSMFFLYAQ